MKPRVLKHSAVSLAAAEAAVGAAGLLSCARIPTYREPLSDMRWEIIFASHSTSGRSSHALESDIPSRTVAAATFGCKG